jgi:hypothetical protein
MSVPAYVVETLHAMTLLQLLLAFLTFIGYALGQGALLGPRARPWVWAMSALGALGFAWLSPDWTHAAVLFGVAVAGMGLFTASVWLLSRGLSVPEESAGVERAELVEVAAVAQAPASAPKPPAQATVRAPAHST